MKKKNDYTSPAVKEMAAMTLEMLTTSGVGSNNGIGYGGVDEDGEKDPASRRYGQWDDMEEEF